MCFDPNIVANIVFVSPFWSLVWIEMDHLSHLSVSPLIRSCHNDLKVDSYLCTVGQDGQISIAFSRSEWHCGDVLQPWHISENEMFISRERMSPLGRCGKQEPDCLITISDCLSLNEDVGTYTPPNFPRGFFFFLWLCCQVILPCDISDNAPDTWRVVRREPSD